MKRSTGHTHPALRRTELIIVLVAIGLLIAVVTLNCGRRTVRFCARIIPVSAAPSRPSGSQPKKGLFTKYGLNVDLRYIAPATSTQGLLAKSLDIVNPGGEIIEAGLNGEPVVYIAGDLEPCRDVGLRQARDSFPGRSQG